MTEDIVKAINALNDTMKGIKWEIEKTAGKLSNLEYHLERIRFQPTDTSGIEDVLEEIKESIEELNLNIK